jgi:hypothetical protein
MKVIFLSVLVSFAVSLFAAEEVKLPHADGKTFYKDNVSAAELVAGCRAMIPENVEISGRIILRNRKGMVRAEYKYELKRKNGESGLKIFDKNGAVKSFSREGGILGTDVTWSDLTLDYLWWKDFSFDTSREAESIHGQKCLVILMRSDKRTVRVWIDRKTGALMQAEELVDGKSARRLWGTRIKKFGERWAPNVLEVETLGSGRRTKITVEELK